MKWTPEEDATLRTLYETTEASARQIAEVMDRTKAAIKGRANILGLRKPAEQHNKGRFEKGHATWNKGVRFVAGGRSAETRFKPGSRPHTWHPVGHERVTKDGYIQRKMTDTGTTRHDYIGLHILLWREHHGEVPQGHVVVFRNGDKTAIRIDNLECITRQELMRRNSYHTNYPPELRQLVQLRGAVTRQINKRKETSK